MAERILLELAGPIEKKFPYLPPTGAQSTDPGARLHASSQTPSLRDAETALVELGIRLPDARQKIEAVLNSRAPDAGPIRTEDLVRAALRSQP